MSRPVRKIVTDLPPEYGGHAEKARTGNGNVSYKTQS